MFSPLVVFVFLVVVFKNTKTTKAKVFRGSLA
jgi:hypothetical protein